VTSSNSNTWLVVNPTSRSISDHSLEPLIKFNYGLIVSPPAPVYLKFTGTSGCTASKTIKMLFENCDDQPSTNPNNAVTIQIPDVYEEDARIDRQLSDYFTFSSSHAIC
jgi:hypothetical protein